MEFLLEHQAASQARSDARMNRIEETVEKVALNQARADGEIRVIRNELRRAVRLSVQEARTERKRRREEDAKLAEADAKLAASQEELRKSLQAFIDSMRQGRNGHDKN